MARKKKISFENITIKPMGDTPKGLKWLIVFTKMEKYKQYRKRKIFYGAENEALLQAIDFKKHQEREINFEFDIENWTIESLLNWYLISTGRDKASNFKNEKAQRNYNLFVNKIIRLCGYISINPGDKIPFTKFKKEFSKEFFSWREEKVTPTKGGASIGLLSSTTIYKRVWVLRSAFESLVEEHVIPFNPLKGNKFKVIKNEPRDVPFGIENNPSELMAVIKEKAPHSSTLPD